MKNFPITFGGKIKLKSSTLINQRILQGEEVQVKVEWELLARMPLNSMVCYYLTDSESKTISFLDTQKPFLKNIFYSQMTIGESFVDIINFSIPYNLQPGKYEISTFVYPTEKFESNGGVRSHVWPQQRVISQFEVEIQTDLAKKFRVYKNSDKTNFFDSLIDYWSSNPSLKENPNIDMWASFALTTNSRGAEILNIIKKYIDIENKNFLDVGCAYCGFLVAAKLEGAKYVEGIEISEQLINFGIQNLKDYKVDAEVLKGDILDKKYAQDRKGLFDIITCNDVIEHVLDPKLTIKNISTMLKKDGICLFEIPNKNHPKFIIKDGHFSVFAITLLEREEALKYFRDSFDGDYSSVGFYKTLETYKGYFNKYDLQFLLDESTLFDVEKSEIYSDIDFLRKNLDSLLATVDYKNRPLVEDRVQKYLQEFDLNKDEMPEQEFLEYYGPAFWRVIGKK